ncbi:MAG: ABC-F family ATP-binding cassette domain-containing protein [Sphaerochaetaceae bacterium]|nr:ABC-F family ATP-binding cassette domain-containing protein [Sphaerochaetaceae bacterium]
MKTLQVQHINLAYGERELLKDVSFTLSERSRSALAGGNGSGKSTLLKIISGIINADTGEITMTRGMRISYLPQSDIVHKGRSLFEEVETSFERFNPILDSISQIEQELADPSAESAEIEQLLIELHELQETILHSSYYQRDAVIERILKGLGFAPEDFGKLCETFSGGWQMRIALAKVLSDDPDVMLLDEPTNYLDIESRIWLRNYIRQYQGAIMMVSHDQDFLDETVDEVYELFGGHLRRYKGNYTKYTRVRKEELERLHAAHQRQVREIERTERFIERFRYKASKAKQVQSREKQLEKIDLIEIPPHLKSLSFSFPPPLHSGNDIFTIKDLSKRYGENTIFSELSLNVNKGDRLAITGHNGAGKTTLLRMLSGIDTDYEGTITVGSDVKIGYFAQDTEKTLHPELTIYEEVEQVASIGDIPRLRSLLGSFLFTSDDIDKKVAVLSGGERSRLALLKILLHPVNVLILDEPTNHLDINAKQMLVRALKEYKGTLLFVSHDTYFVKRIASSILYLSEDSPQLFVGDWDYFSYRLEQKELLTSLEEPASQNASRKQEEQPKSSVIERKEYNKARNRLQNLIQQQHKLIESIEAIDNKVEEVTIKMGEKENYSDKERITSLIAMKEKLEKEKEEAEENWFAMGEQIEQLKEYIG